MSQKQPRVPKHKTPGLGSRRSAPVPYITVRYRDHISPEVPVHGCLPAALAR
ncbi:unnamed protein product [Tuber melanosporum]|uniref:(Perigord truffle) hypothetical protein n=1 Tax=Tuber melanosporum (strain Mel28) TaxID=656061 RepID=D5G7P5_TUBMM|nr:uncharacterized protein GSTUM_00004666001 [Tuber melanosporum]CAZ80538.1 unnamed protein product [Tuber melanosporum]